MKTKNQLCLILLLLSSSVQLFGQDELPTQKWQYTVEPYVMFPNMSGNTALGNLPELNVNVDSGQIFSNLQFGAMLYFEASNEKWNFNSDLLYMNLAKGIKNRYLIDSGEVSAKQLGWELAALYKIKPWLEVGIGGLLNSVETGLDINRKNIGGGTTNIQKERSQTWLDPMLIAVFKNTAGKKITYSLRGEIGGFGIGSDLAWQLQAYAGYRFSKLFEIQGGYRAISLDYATGSGSDYYLYNIDTYGPQIRFGFNF